MAKRQHWYLDGWHYENAPGGGGRKTLVYRGEYYTFGLEKAELARMRLTYLMLAALTTAVYIAFSLTPAPGGQLPYAGACILALLPLIYLDLGAVNLMLAPEKMTYRHFFASYKRIRLSSFFLAPLFAVGFLGQAVYTAVLLSRGESPAGTDILWLAGVGVCLAASVAVLVMQIKTPARMIPPELK